VNITVIGWGHFAGVVAQSLDWRGHNIWQQDESPHLRRIGQKEIQDEPGYRPYHPKDFPPDVVWIAYDCPLDETGFPITSEIEARIARVHERYGEGVPFFVSCQWPVGTMKRVAALCPGRELVYVLENVRVGKALQDFADNPLTAVGAARDLSHDAKWLLDELDPSVTLMSWESAELSKHALNAFMALQIAFVNELADVAEYVDADHLDISRALLADPRVSPFAPLHAGAPFGGGSLQRDLLVLEKLSAAPILNAIRASNDSRI